MVWSTMSSSRGVKRCGAMPMMQNGIGMAADCIDDLPSAVPS